MKLSVGIVGLPNVGKSTLFKALTQQEINIANYPFATIDPNVGVVSVPDERLDKLSAMSKSEKKVPAVVEFYDIAGLVKGANKGEGLGNQFLANIREVSAIVQVVRVFESADILHVEEKVDPVRDIEIINAELILKDIETLDRRIATAEKDAKTGDKERAREYQILKDLRAVLDNGGLANTFSEELLLHPVVRELQLLTAKKQIYLLNGADGDVSEELKAKIADLDSDYFVVDLSVDPDIGGLIQKAYEILGLISFLTTGEKESRAWTVREGMRSPEAAGVIHTDFEKKFIKADVIYWEDLLAAGSWVTAKQAGKVRLEGKEYVVKDGDVVEIKHG